MNSSRSLIAPAMKFATQPEFDKGGGHICCDLCRTHVLLSAARTAVLLEPGYVSCQFRHSPNTLDADMFKNVKVFTYRSTFTTVPRTVQH